jgi:hypothetical protein
MRFGWERLRRYPPILRGSRSTHGESSPPGDPKQLGEPGYRGAIIPMVPQGAVPMQQRLEGNDYHNYSQPIPRELQHQSYWFGNQVPIATTQTQAHPYWIHVRTFEQVAPQRKQGSFNMVLGAVQSSTLIERWHALWQSQTPSQ